MKKRMLNIILCVLISILAMPVFHACAGNNAYTDDTAFVINAFDNSTAEITKYKGADKHIVIPESIDGLTIIKIGKYAFSHSDIESIVIPETVETIEAFAFEDCRYLHWIRFTGNKPDVDDTAFSDINFDSNTLPRLFIPETWNKADIPSDSATQWHGGYFSTSIYNSENLTNSSKSNSFPNPSLIIAVSAIVLFAGTVVVLVTVIKRERIQHFETKQKLNS